LIYTPSTACRAQRKTTKTTQSRYPPFQLKFEPQKTRFFVLKHTAIAMEKYKLRVFGDKVLRRIQVCGFKRTQILG
jgi:hypothetical protein